MWGNRNLTEEELAAPLEAYRQAFAAEIRAMLPNAITTCEMPLNSIDIVINRANFDIYLYDNATFGLYRRYYKEHALVKNDQWLIDMADPKCFEQLRHIIESNQDYTDL